MMTRTTIIAMVAAVLGLAVACGDAPKNASTAASPKAAAPSAPSAVKAPSPIADAADAGTAVTSEYRYEYNPVSKRDPFRSFFEDPKGDAERAEACSEPLCTWDLDQLSLVAVVSGDANPIAMVEDPTKTGHMIRRATKMGKQGGQVTQILRDCIVVTEYWLGADNRRTAKPVKVCIKQEQAKSPVTDLMNPSKRYQ